MPSKVITAAAGARKSTRLVELAAGNPEKRTLVLTFTIDNLQTIHNYFIAKYGILPMHVTTNSWYSFLLREGVRPYQNVLYPKGPRIESVFFNSDLPPFKIPRSATKEYYLTGDRLINKDRLAEFVHFTNAADSNCVVDRLKDMYDRIFIDEIQDMSGYDWLIIEALMNSGVEVYCVGDPRQSTFSTSNNRKNAQYRGAKCIDVFSEWKKKGLCLLEEWNECYRSNQVICDYADGIYPTYTPTKSVFADKSMHDGVYVVCPEHVADYIGNFNPTILRDNVRSNTLGFAAVNIGISKGKTFERVLIFPTSPMQKYLKSLNPDELKEQSRADLYVAITRARHSVAFVIAKKDFNAIKLPAYCC